MGFLSVIATPGGCYWDVRHIGIGTLGTQVFRGATNPVHLRALSQNLIFLFSRATAGLEGEGPALSPLEAGAQRSWSVRSNTSSVWMSPSESSPTGQPSTARRPAVVAFGR